MPPKPDVEMTDVRVLVSKDLMDALRTNLGLRTNAEVVQEALTLVNWAAEEKQRGRLILSTNQQGGEVERLAMKSLTVVEKK